MINKTCFLHVILQISGNKYKKAWLSYAASHLDYTWVSESVLRLCTVYMNVHCIFCVATFYMHSSFEATKITHYLQLSMAHLFKPMSEAAGINQGQLIKILAGVK